MSQLLVIGADESGVLGQQNLSEYQSQQMAYLSSQNTNKSNRKLASTGSQGYNNLTKAQNYLSEDSSEILTFVLNGGPKWGFRIKQLQDGRVIISRIDKGPAEKCGLRVYDEILSVNNVQLVNSPCSLLLEEHNQAAIAETDRAPLLSSKFTFHADDKLASDQKQAPLRVELSKLDFAYQLIRHSSGANNKLMLTVKRFLSFSYARASVLAASESPWLQGSKMGDNENIGRSKFDDWSSGMNLGGESVREKSGDFLSKTKAILRSHYQEEAANSLKRQQAAGSVYKCCDCYCNQEGE